MAIDQTTTETPKNPPPGASAPTVQTIEDLLAAPPDVKLAMIERTTDVLLALATSLMSEEVRSMAGPRYSRHKPYGGRYVRWGSNPGSVRVGAERVPVDVPRVRDRETGTERPLRSYRALHEGTDPGPKMAEAVLLGLAQRDYERVARTSAESFGLSQSTVSRRFTEEAQAALEDLEARDLSGEPYLVLWLDGKQLRGRQVVICIGATTAGQKRVLGFTEASTENAPAVKGLLRRLIDRGLDFSGGLLVVTDGSKGLRSAVQATFGGYAVLQRCHWLGAGKRARASTERRATGLAAPAAGGDERDNPRTGGDRPARVRHGPEDGEPPGGPVAGGGLRRRAGRPPAWRRPRSGPSPAHHQHD